MSVNRDRIAELFSLPLGELISLAHQVHGEFHDAGQIQLSSLLSIKTGGCPENCSYCPQSAHYETNITKHGLLSVEEVVRTAQAAQASGATRFCMGAAWREVRSGPEFDRVLEMVRAVNALGMQTCCTLGMLTAEQAQALAKAGLYAYNHNIDTSREHYEKVISTRGFDDRLRTIENVRQAGITVCTGGILGMGESEQDRISFLHTLANLSPQPESVTINSLVRIAGTPLAEQAPLSIFELVRVIAVARIIMPHAMIRLSAGRMSLSDEGQFLCFYAGANSVFLGEKLLTSPNPKASVDFALFEQVQLRTAEL